MSAARFFAAVEDTPEARVLLASGDALIGDYAGQ